MRKKVMQHKRWIIFVVILLLVMAWCAPLTVYAEAPTGPINYMDLDYTVKEGAAYNQVTVPIPAECLYLGIYNQSTKSNVAALRGRSFITYTVDPGIGYTLRVYPFSVYGLLLDNIPEGTMLNFTLRVDVEGTENFYIPSLHKDYFYNDIYGTRIGNVIMSQIEGTVGEVVNISYELKAFPDDAYSFVPYFCYDNFGTALGGSARYTFTVTDVSLSMNISNGYWEQWLAEQNGQMIDDLGDRIEGSISDSTDQITGSIEDSTDEITGSIQDATDEIMSGGEQGEILDQKDDALTDTAGVVNDGLASIESFQGQYMDAAAAELQDLVVSADITLLATDMVFVQKYANKIFYSIPDAYVVVFTLPLLFGIVMYVLGHPVRVSRLGNSGDKANNQMTTKEIERKQTE